MKGFLIGQKTFPVIGDQLIEGNALALQVHGDQKCLEALLALNEAQDQRCVILL